MARDVADVVNPALFCCDADSLITFYRDRLVGSLSEHVCSFAADDSYFESFSTSEEAILISFTGPFTKLFLF